MGSATKRVGLLRSFPAIENPPELKHPRHEAAVERVSRKSICDLALDPISASGKD